MIGIILGSATVLVVGILACITCCCCCCAPAFCALFSVRSHKPDSFQYHTVRTAAPVSNSYTTSVEEVPIVEAYVVPPLAAVNPKPSSSTISTMLDETVAHPVDSHTGFRDVWAAVLFLLQLAVMVCFAVQSGYSLRHEGEEDSYVDMRTASALVMLVALCSAVCFFMSSTLFSLIVAWSDVLISFMLYLNILISLGVAVACLLSAQLIGALIFGAITVVNYLYTVSVQDRIPFASAMLRTACTAMKHRFFSLLLTSFAALGLQLSFCALWSVAVVYVYQRWQMETAYTQGDDEDVSAEFSGYYVLLLFSLYWTLQVVQYIVSMVVGGTVACWYFLPLHPAPLKSSLFRACTYSFGSVCYGALLVAVLHTLRYIISMLKRKERRRERDGDGNLLLFCFLYILDILVSALEGLVMYINKYAYSYIAAYGLDFYTSGKHVYNLFERRGWVAIINDNLISYTLTLVSVMVGLMGAVVGAVMYPVLYAYAASYRTPYAAAVTGEDWVLQAVVGGCVGLAVGCVVANMVVYMIDAAVSMVCVCFAEDPQTLLSFHPREYGDLLAAWVQFDPYSISWHHRRPGGGAAPRGGSIGGTYGGVDEEGTEMYQHRSYQHNSAYHKHAHAPVPNSYGEYGYGVASPVHTHPSYPTYPTYPTPHPASAPYAYAPSPPHYPLDKGGCEVYTPSHCTHDAQNPPPYNPAAFHR